MHDSGRCFGFFLVFVEHFLKARRTDLDDFLFAVLLHSQQCFFLLTVWFLIFINVLTFILIDF